MEDDRSDETASGKSTNEVTYGYLNQISQRCSKKQDGKLWNYENRRSL
jgi:hypothetical protein